MSAPSDAKTAAGAATPLDMPAFGFGRLSRLPEGHPRPRRAALPQPARAFCLLAGQAAALAVHLRRRLPPGARRLDHPALQDLCALRGLHHAGPVRHDPACSPACSRRCRWSTTARWATCARCWSAPSRAGSCWSSKLLAGVTVSIAQVYVFLAVAWFWGVKAPPHRLSDGAAGAVPRRADARRARPAAVVDDQAARKFRRRHELRHLPDVFRLVRRSIRCGASRNRAPCSTRSALPTRSPMPSN